MKAARNRVVSSLAATPVLAAALVLATAGDALAQLATASLETTPAAQVDSAEPTSRESDPFEGLNRVIWAFNDKVDVYFLEPAARGWRWAAPQSVRNGFTNFFRNLRSPVVIGNNILQGHPLLALENFGRFFVNTGLGVAGFVDITGCDGVERRSEDFGQTLGVWKVPAGPYLVLPFLGPSTVRDFAGTLVDYPLAIWPPEVKPEELAAERTLQTIHWRSGVIEEIEDAKATSLDYYTFVRNLYFQQREIEIRNGEGVTAESEDDLYYFDGE